MYRLPKSRWWCALHHQPSGKCKSTPQKLRKGGRRDRQYQVLTRARSSEHSALLVWFNNCTAALGNSLAFLTKLNIHLSFEPWTSTPRYLPKKNDNLYPKKPCVYIAALFILAPNGRNPEAQWENGKASGVCPGGGIVLSDEKERATDACRAAARGVPGTSGWARGQGRKSAYCTISFTGNSSKKCKANDML